MKKLKVFSAKRMTSELEKPETIDLMNDEVNNALANWVEKANIKSYHLINSQLTSSSEFTIFGQLNASLIILSVHVSYEA